MSCYYDKKPKWSQSFKEATHLLLFVVDGKYGFAVRRYGDNFYPSTDENSPCFGGFSIVEERPDDTKTTDHIKEPSHYQFFGNNSIDIIARSMTPEMWKGFCQGNALKYRIRAGKKDDLQQDIDKSNYYEELYETKKSLCHPKFEQQFGRMLRLNPDVVIDHANNAEKLNGDFTRDSIIAARDANIIKPRNFDESNNTSMFIEERAITIEEITQAEINIGNLPGLKDGEPCDHKGCLNHVSHPCEGCGRIGGKACAPHSMEAEVNAGSLGRFISENGINTFSDPAFVALKTEPFDITLTLYSSDLGVHTRVYRDIHGEDYEDAKANATQAAHDDGLTVATQEDIDSGKYIMKFDVKQSDKNNG